MNTNNSNKMWVEIDNKLTKTFDFNDFSEAFAFITRVALLAEKQSHHPEWKNIYSLVEIKLCTHDAGDKITEKDHLLAKSIDALL